MHAFTLIEMMVAMAVMSLLLVLIAQLFTAATTLTTSGNKRMDADSQARLVFDRMAIDFTKLVKRPDVDYYFQKNGGSDQMAFYSESTGYYPAGVSDEKLKSTVSLVGYRIKDGKLERLSKALVWNGVSTGGGQPLTFLPRKLTEVWPSIGGAGTDLDYHVIGDQVFRMEISFLVRDMSISPLPDPFFSDAPYVAPLTATNLNGLQSVMAVIVTIAVLDNKSRAVLAAGKLEGASGELKDADFGSPDAELPAKPWQKAAEGGLGISKAASQQVRVYQRYFYLNPIF